MQFKIIPNIQTPAVPQIESVQDFISENGEVLREFLYFASRQPRAAGLAANQCSLDDERFSLRCFAWKDGDNWVLAIDPKIVSSGGIRELKVEGCLTWIGKTIIAERDHWVQVSYYDEQGIKKFGKYRGFEAQVWQHEINHLNGVEERVEDGGFILPRGKKVGVNEKCPCGSGKKYKKCCME